MKRGIKNEPLVFAAYVRRMKEEHQNVKASRPGFRHYQEKPFMGASLDVVTECDCFGKSAAELKCPDADDNYTRNGQLPNTHKYYYQVQMQMMVLNIPKCDFVVYRDNKSLSVTSVKRDEIVIQEIIVKGTIYFERVIPPELIGRYFTSRRAAPRAPLRAIQNQQPQAAQNICSCQKPSDGQVIICCRQTCTVKIYHMKCVNMKKKLKRWLCPSCKVKL